MNLQTKRGYFGQNSPRSDRSPLSEEALPHTIKGCTEELEKVNASLVQLTRRHTRLTTRLRQLQLNITEESSITQFPDFWAPKDVFTIKLENRISKATDISEISQMMSGIASSPIPDQDEELDLCSPLITALKTLQRRRGQQRGVKMWTKTLANLFFMTDVDGSGLIDVNEYIEMIKELDLSDGLKSVLAEKFTSIDVDGSGDITLSEFVQFFHRFPSFKQELLKHAENNSPYINEKTLNWSQQLRQWLYCTVEYPQYNIFSKILFCVDGILVMVPVVIICLEALRPSYPIEWYKPEYMWCSSIFFAVEYLCGLATCRYKKVFLYNPGHILDAISFMFWIVYNTFGRPGSLDPMGFVIFRVPRLVKIHHIFNLEGLREDLGIYMQTLTLAYTSYGALTGLLTFAILFFSLIMFTFERGEYDMARRIWVRDAAEGESPFSNIYTCFYFTVVTMTTLGYGDVSPKTYVGKAVAMMTVLVGLCNLTFLINIVGDCFEDVFREYILRRSHKLEEEHSKYICKCIEDERRRYSKFRSCMPVCTKRVVNVPTVQLVQ